MVQRVHVLAGTVLSLSLVGCYTLRPTGGSTPAVGTRVAFDVNDAGRFALGGALGPEIAQIEGRLLEQENGEYVLAVSGVRQLRGGEQTWNGETVRIKREHVNSTYERRFSRGRTIALGVTGVGLVAFIVTRSLIGSGNDPTPVPGDSSHTQLIPAPQP
jgi:hypothetical protein